jgi:exodeoxyribonuclease V beta subunit
VKTLDPETLPLHGTAVVEASAGTGKTYTITSLFVRLLVESELEIDQILVVTYTRAATAELRDRIRKRLAAALLVARGEASDDDLLVRLCAGKPELALRLERALAGVDEAPVLTIHGFCQRVLRDLAFESGAAFESQLLAHAAPLLEEIADDYFMRELYAAPAERASTLLNEPASLRELAARVGGRELRVIPERRDDVVHDRQAYQDALAKCRALWASERIAITAIVRGLKGVGAKADSYADGMHAGLQEGTASALLSRKTFRLFTRSGASEGARAPVEHAFLDAAEELHRHACLQVEAERNLTLGFRRGFVDYVQHELDRRARESRVRTFDALLSDLDRALAGAGGPVLVERLRAKYRAALVDEFQDTDPLQYRIFGRVFAAASTPLFLIGDPKQAIYGFRGADVAAYLAAREAAGENVYTLDVNWRSDPSLIEALNALYARVQWPFALPQIAYQPVRAAQGDRLRHGDGRPPVDIAMVTEPAASSDALVRQLATLVASDIAALLASGARVQDGARTRELRAQDVAVLTRTNKQAAQVQQALAAQRVPSVLSGDASVLDSDDVAQLERALHALAHPADARALRAFLSSIYGGLDAARILELESKDADWEEHRTQFARLHELWLSRGFVQAIRGLSELYEIEQRLLARPDGTRRITNLWHLVELLAEASVSQRLGPLGLLRWLALVQQDQAMRTELVGDAHELRLESNEDAVQLTTIHKSKGLEYPVVYLPFSWTAAELFPSEKRLPRFHDPRAADALTLDLGSEHVKEHVGIAEQETLQESLRLLYVGLTRAKHRVTLVIPQHKAFAKSALAYTLLGGGERDALVKSVEAMVKEQRLAFPTMRTLVPSDAPPYVGRAPQVSAPARKVQRALDQSYRVASFSALIARERTVASEQGIDRDASHEEPPKDVEEPSSTLTLGSFPRGTVAGQLVHEVLEHADFTADRSELAQVVERFVRARAYPLSLVDSLTRGLAEMLATPLSPTLRLDRVSRAERVDEMEFVFPVDRMLSPRTLERAFRNHDAPRAYPPYAKYVKELGFDELHGYLRGFIDLVFRHQGKFYVVDYKSNYLGPRAEDYGQARLAEAMAHHHYYLQYHLYTVALHRHLAQRLAGYDYEQHFGGVYYLFLRGMAPAHALRTGVYFDRPPRALIDELDRALREEGP